MVPLIFQLVPCSSNPSPMSHGPTLLIVYCCYAESMAAESYIIYVGDIVFIGSISSLIFEVISKLQAKFSLRYLGCLSYFGASISFKTLFLINRDMFTIFCHLFTWMVGNSPSH